MLFVRKRLQHLAQGPDVLAQVRRLALEVVEFRQRRLGLCAEKQFLELLGLVAELAERDHVAVDDDVEQREHQVVRIGLAQVPALAQPVQVVVPDVCRVFLEGEDRRPVHGDAHLFGGQRLLRRVHVDDLERHEHGVAEFLVFRTLRGVGHVLHEHGGHVDGCAHGFDDADVVDADHAHPDDAVLARRGDDGRLAVFVARFGETAVAVDDDADVRGKGLGRADIGDGAEVLVGLDVLGAHVPEHDEASRKGNWPPRTGRTTPTRYRRAVTFWWRDVSPGAGLTRCSCARPAPRAKSRRPRP